MLERLIALGNPFVIWLLRSPLHGLLSKAFMLVTYTGRKSGNKYTVPVNYVREGDVLTVTSRPERRWWRNLKGGQSVTVRIQGQDRQGCPEVLAAGDPSAIALLQAYYRALGSRQLAQEQAARLAEERVVIRVRLTE